MGVDQVTGDVRTEATGAAGDQHRAVGGPAGAGVHLVGSGGDSGGGGDPGQPRHTDLAVTQQQLRLTGGQGGGQQRGWGVGEPDGDKPVRVLRLRCPDQAPHRLGSEVVDPADEDQPGAGQPRIGQPLLEGGQRVGGGDPDVTGPDADERPLGGGSAGIDRRTQRGDVRVSGCRADPLVAEHTPAGGARWRGPVPQLRPLQPEQPLVIAAPGGGELGGGDRPGDEGAYRGDRRAGGISEGHRDAVPGGGGDPHPHLGGARRVQGDVVPGERDAHLVVGGFAVAGRRIDGVQGGVQHRRVQAEASGVRAAVDGERHLGVHLGTAPPDGLEALEDRAVAVALAGQHGIGIGQVNRLGAPGRPLGERGAGVGGLRSEDAADMPGPELVARLVGAGVDGHRAASRRVGGADHHLEGDPALIQRQRRLQGQLLHRAAADLVPGPDRQLHECGAGQQHHPGDHVVGQPRVAAQRHPAGEHHPVTAGQADDRTHQRVAGS